VRVAFRSWPSLSEAYQLYAARRRAQSVTDNGLGMKPILDYNMPALGELREGQMKRWRHLIIGCGLVGPLTGVSAFAADAVAPKGFHSFGPDQTIADISKLEWKPLQLEGLPPGVEIASLRGDLAKGGGEILLRVPANYTVPNHSHTSDELYVWLKGRFAYIAGDGTQVEMESPAYISLPGNTPHALKCHDEPCVFYLRYSRPFDLHVHPMPK
jgi:quercetin dioxygenase-like cupin family protein